MFNDPGFRSGMTLIWLWERAVTMLFIDLEDYATS